MHKVCMFVVFYPNNMLRLEVQAFRESCVYHWAHAFSVGVGVIYVISLFQFCILASK